MSLRTTPNIRNICCWYTLRRGSLTSKSNARPFSKMAKYPSYLRPSNLEETANFQHSKRSRDLNPTNGCYFSIVNLRRCNKRGNNSGLHGWCCVGDGGLWWSFIMEHVRKLTWSVWFDRSRSLAFALGGPPFLRTEIHKKNTDTVDTADRFL